nr:colicin-like pore-forming protein [Serratia quinivorans]
MIAGKLASALVAFAFAALTATPLGILGFGLIMAITGALVDTKLMDQINNSIFK